MSRSLWRIASDTPDYAADDMTGKGAKQTGGRWNGVGVAMIYTSATRALSCLETFVHLNAGRLPLNRYLVEVRVPDGIWNAAERLELSTLDLGWDAEPAGLVSIGLGTKWANDSRSALLIVPSVIVPEEANVLINPAHADAASLTARKVRKWLYDPRLSRAA